MNKSIERFPTDDMDRHTMVLSMVSHDLKSPMVAIIGFASILKSEMQEKGADPKWQLYLQRLLDAGTQVTGLIDDVLSMAKLEAGRETVEPDWVYDLPNEMEETLSTFEFEAGAKEITLELGITEPIPSVRWDFRRLRLHVLNNVISNALKFTPQGGKITLSAASTGDRVSIQVRDTGPGIPETELERIFSRFEQVDLKTARVSRGAGLGLSNACLFIKRHGGFINATNASDPKGAVFTIDLPADSMDFAQSSSETFVNQSVGS